MASGTIVAESLRVGAVLDGPPLTVGPISRVEAGISAEQREAGLAEHWTLIAFEVADDRAAELADALAAVLDEPGWYADLHTATRSFVAFAGRVFAYEKGDAAGRAEAEAHARAHGVPDEQIDWP